MGSSWLWLLFFLLDFWGILDHGWWWYLRFSFFLFRGFCWFSISLRGFCWFAFYLRGFCWFSICLWGFSWFVLCLWCFCRFSILLLDLCWLSILLLCLCWLFLYFLDLCHWLNLLVFLGLWLRLWLLFRCLWLNLGCSWLLLLCWEVRSSFIHARLWSPDRLGSETSCLKAADVLTLVYTLGSNGAPFAYHWVRWPVTRHAF